MNQLNISGRDSEKDKKDSFLKRYYKKCFLFLVLVFIVGAILNYYLLDGLAGLLGSSFFGDDTLYTSGYTDKLFRKIKPGMTKNEVLWMMGYPFKVFSSYVMEKRGYLSYCYIIYKDNVIKEIYIDPVMEQIEKEEKITSDEFSLENFKKIKKGMNRHEVISLIGYPLQEAYIYSKAEHGHSYRRRNIVLMNDIVIRKVNEFYFD